MIITKKKFEEEIAKARAEEKKRFEEYTCRRDEERYQNERHQEIWNRLDKAFADIDRRLTALEKQTQRTNYDVPVCSRY